MQEHNTSILFNKTHAYLVPHNNSTEPNITYLINDNSVLELATLDPTKNLYEITPQSVYCDSTIPQSHSISTIRRYATVNLKNMADTVNFWHCALGHPDADIMVKVLDQSHPT
jgi:hypothetical protein